MTAGPPSGLRNTHAGPFDETTPDDATVGTDSGGTGRGSGTASSGTSGSSG